MQSELLAVVGVQQSDALTLVGSRGSIRVGLNAVAVELGGGFNLLQERSVALNEGKHGIGGIANALHTEGDVDIGREHQSVRTLNALGGLGDLRIHIHDVEQDLVGVLGQPRGGVGCVTGGDGVGRDVLTSGQNAKQVVVGVASPSDAVDSGIDLIVILDFLIF